MSYALAEAELNRKGKIVTNTHEDSLYTVSYTYPHAFLSVPPGVTETDCETD